VAWTGGLEGLSQSGWKIDSGNKHRSDEKGIDTFAKKVRSPLLKTDATFHVYDRQNGMDINGAEVEVYDALAVLKGSGKTGIDGTWTISSLKSNFYLILVMAEGYRSYYEIKGLYGDTVEIPLARISQPAFNPPDLLA